MRYFSRAFVGGVCLAFSADTALAQRDELVLEIKARFEANGDAVLTQSMKLLPARYQTMKQAIPNPYKFLRDMSSGRADFEMTDATARYDDATSSVVLGMKQLGALKNLGGGVWEWSEDDDEGGPIKGQFFNQSKDARGRITMNFVLRGDLEGGAPVSGTGVLTLPPGARNAAWDEEGRRVTFSLPVVGAGRTGTLTHKVKAKDTIMTGAYKVYGLKKAAPGQWVGKTIFKNVGNGPIRDLRVRYRVQGYSEWSLWDRHPEVIPGQTVVSVYYPIFDKSVAALRTKTPTNMVAEWKYIDGAGVAREDSDGQRITLLGVNDFVFGNLTAGEVFDGLYEEMVNNAELLASWISRDDPVVRDFAYLANKRAGGAAASVDDDQATQALRAAYELMVANDITYNSPPGIVEQSKSFDEKMVQNVKHPREVIRQRSGTCIDLAILYASMVHAMGMKPYLVLIPGHAYPAVRLPSGQMVAIETTGVAGGSRLGGTGQAATFEQVAKRGMEELKQAMEEQVPSKVIDVQKEWAKGISNPELEALPATILQQWGIQDGAGGPSPSDAGLAQGGASATVSGVDFSGSWAGQAVEKTAQGQIQYDVNIVAQRGSGNSYRCTFGGRAKMQTQMGPMDVIITGDGINANVQADGSLLVVVDRLVTTVLATGERQVGEGNAYSIRLDGGRLEGTDRSGAVRLSLRRQTGGPGGGMAAEPSGGSAVAAPAASMLPMTFMATHEHGFVLQANGDFSCYGQLTVSPGWVKFSTPYRGDSFATDCQGTEFSGKGGKLKIKAGRTFNLELSGSTVEVFQGAMEQACGR